MCFCAAWAPELHAQPQIALPQPSPPPIHVSVCLYLCLLIMCVHLQADAPHLMPAEDDLLAMAAIPSPSRLQVSPLDDVFVIITTLELL